MSSQQMGLAVALGAGLLVGLERERRKGQGDDREAAGLRTFMVAALTGAVAQMLSAVLAAMALAGVAALAALSYWRSRSRDPGLTTELALLATALIGMLAVEQPALAAGCAAVLAAVLAARERLHHFATEWLSERELHDGLLLSALVLVLLPLLPASPVSWLGQLSAQRVLMLVIMILLMQAAGHVGRRLLGARAGLALSGLLGGFVSSTATISAMGSLVRGGQAPLRLALCASVLSMAATWLQILLMATLVSVGAAQQVWSLVCVGVAVPVVLGALTWHRDGVPEPVQDKQPAGTQGVLRLREAVSVTMLLVGGAVLVSLAQQQGVGGLLMGTALAALADAHAPMASLMGLFGAGHLSQAHLLWGLMVALSANAVTRTGVALTSGGQRFGLGVGLALALNLLCAGAWVVWLLR
ncbi:MAG TPA: DUF4010 domain-containing protein [Aquabacterium sp.]|uniref:DUF4010 domain-containing protein n=1 Tax=Aquabacterium sp. TaxID=1872578 RepID=UPI002E332F2A|nr:DUF4010 domain-containing protein [Aquabacterium sp.]HEX5355342.1 DUF4010 domain-containing protein [Aquabacterium sp.]